MQSEEKKKQAIQCLIRGYGLLDDKESSEKVLNLVEEGLKTDYLNDSAKRTIAVSGVCIGKRRKERGGSKHICRDIGG